MGLTSEYLKFHPVGVFGLVTSSRCPPVYLSSRLVACGCNENVLVWNIATGLRSALLRGESSQGKSQNKGRVLSWKIPGTIKFCEISNSYFSDVYRSQTKYQK